MLLARFIAEVADLCTMTMQSLHLTLTYPPTDGYTIVDTLCCFSQHLCMCVGHNIAEPASTILFNMWNWPVM